MMQTTIALQFHISVVDATATVIRVPVALGFRIPVVEATATVIRAFSGRPLPLW